MWEASYKPVCTSAFLSNMVSGTTKLAMGVVECRRRGLGPIAVAGSTQLTWKPVQALGLASNPSASTSNIRTQSWHGDVCTPAPPWQCSDGKLNARFSLFSAGSGNWNHPSTKEPRTLVPSELWAT